MKKKVKRSVLVVMAQAFMLLALQAGAEGAGQPDNDPVKTISAPVVGKTRVVSTTFLPDPFIRTVARTAVGYGRSSYIVTPLLEIDGEPVLGLEGRLLYAVLSFEYRFAVREWVAVWGRINLTARLGTEIQSLLAQGVSAAYGFELGWMFRLYQDDRHLLSASIAARNGSATLVDILGWANGVIDEDGVELIRSSPTIGTVGDIRYVYALNSVVSLMLNGSLSYSEAVERSVGNEWYYSAGGLASLDISGKTGIPVGLALGYKYSTLPEGGDEIVEDIRSILAGVSYVGRPDFHLGVDLQLQRVPIRGIPDPARFLTAVISMQYFF